MQKLIISMAALALLGVALGLILALAGGSKK